MAVFNCIVAGATASLPMDRYEAEQFLYGLRIDQADAEYEMELIGGDYLLVLDSDFRELNRLAQRIDEMGDFPRESFDAWLSAHDLCTVEDALLATYHTDWIEFHPGFDTDEMLGEFALENGIFEDYNYLPTDIYEMLDQAKVGARMREQDGGQFVEGGYLIAGDFSGEKLPAEKPLAFFQVRFSDGQDKSAWFELPLTAKAERNITEFLQKEDLSKLNMDCRSLIPQLNGIVSGSDELPELCDLDKALSGMSGEEIQKYKALLELFQPGTAWTALQLANEMQYYEVDTQLTDPETYGRNHLTALVDLAEDDPLMQCVDFVSYGTAMLQADGCESTRYGTVCRNVMAQKFLASPNTIYSGEYYCGRTEGLPTFVCWDPDTQKVWLELSAAASNGLIADLPRYRAACEDWGIRHCASHEGFEQVLAELGVRPFDEAMAEEQVQAFGGMDGLT